MYLKLYGLHRAIDNGIMFQSEPKRALRLTKLLRPGRGRHNAQDDMMSAHSLHNKDTLNLQSKRGLTRNRE